MGSNRKLVSLLLVSSLPFSLSVCATTPPPPTSVNPPPSTAAQSTVKDDCTGITNHNIEVGARVSCKWVFVKTNDAGSGNTVNWRATDPNKKMKIIFDNSAVFPSLYCPGDKNVCQSGALSTSLHGDPSVDYRYHAYLCDDVMHCGSEVDPGIIIVP